MILNLQIKNQLKTFEKIRSILREFQVETWGDLKTCYEVIGFKFDLTSAQVSTNQFLSRRYFELTRYQKIPIVDLRNFLHIISDRFWNIICYLNFQRLSAFIACAHVWIYSPLKRSHMIKMGCMAEFWSVILKVVFNPLFDSCGKILSQVNIEKKVVREDFRYDV